MLLLDEQFTKILDGIGDATHDDFLVAFSKNDLKAISPKHEKFKDKLKTYIDFLTHFGVKDDRTERWGKLSLGMRVASVKWGIYTMLQRDDVILNRTELRLTCSLKLGSMA